MTHKVSSHIILLCLKYKDQSSSSMKSRVHQLQFKKLNFYLLRQKITFSLIKVFITKQVCGKTYLDGNTVFL